MSTLMSRDLNIERSSTRLHAPPGGKSSISFGDGSSSFDQSEPNKVSARSHNKANNMSTLSFGDSNSQQVDDRFTKQQQAPPQQQQPNNYSQGSSMGNLLNGSETENLQPQQYSARSGAAGSSMGNLISGGSESQPSSARGRRQAPGGNSTIVIG